ncbi:hypothetical protein CEUSTIGMA_g8439.t1 [Chlamydomonas eustigma]|uniref:Bidirectional sugar transporter SWEET n=1 Tax=Chlamydomonas eustigma TaxID=1157962 RepID=A0A250XD44_9CHLO|nr:hypothetical protein CEUSTIGMA_g8439.t1 [Chlamydomonas eustigma]|eukprot:GAX81004.1 hypothetical protein CEUSTIGMA_g8439.t1 [Chlamydomonas eustigma]
MGDFLLESFVPGLGALVSLLMYGAPLSAVLKAASSRSLGDLNAIPFSITIANTIIWLSYGLLKHDPFITTPNAPGVCLAVFCTMTTYGLADETVKSRMRMILCGQAVLLPLLGVLTAFACSNLTEQLSLWGLSGNAISLVYYGAPLSTMAEVIKTRNSASILLPLTLMNLVNALLW